MASQTLTVQMTDEQLERHAFKVLAKELGLGGLARFIRLNCSGRGNYTANRHTWQAEIFMDDIRRELERSKTETWRSPNKLAPLKQMIHFGNKFCFGDIALANSNHGPT